MEEVIEKFFLKYKNEGMINNRVWKDKYVLLLNINDSVSSNIETHLYANKLPLNMSYQGASNMLILD